MLITLSTLLVLLTTVIAAVPEKCGSGHPTFTLDPINFSSYYTYTTPAASGPKLATFSFLLKNDETDYDVACRGAMSMPLGQFYGWYPAFNCTTPGNPDWKQTSFTYDSNTNLVAVNTTWDCGGYV
jgi:YD repeat-containing protein